MRGIVAGQSIEFVRDAREKIRKVTSSWQNEAAVDDRDLILFDSAPTCLQITRATSTSEVEWVEERRKGWFRQPVHSHPGKAYSPMPIVYGSLLMLVKRPSNQMVSSR
jgi:hypothetical protein